MRFDLHAAADVISGTVRNLGNGSTGTVLDGSVNGDETWAGGGSPQCGHVRLVRPSVPSARIHR